jgi:hypothetical protein
VVEPVVFAVFGAVNVSDMPGKASGRRAQIKSVLQLIGGRPECGSSLEFFVGRVKHPICPKVQKI